MTQMDGLEVTAVGTLEEAIKATLEDRAEARGGAVPAMLG